MRLQIIRRRENGIAYPRDGAASCCDARDQALSPGRVIGVRFAASKLANPQGCNAGNVGRSHAGTTENLVAAVQIRAEDFGAWCGDIRFESEVES